MPSSMPIIFGHLSQKRNLGFILEVILTQNLPVIGRDKEARQYPLSPLHQASRFPYFGSLSSFYPPFYKHFVPHLPNPYQMSQLIQLFCIPPFFFFTLVWLFVITNNCFYKYLYVQIFTVNLKLEINKYKSINKYQWFLILIKVVS